MKKGFSYLPAGLDRLMAAILLQAVRDVFSSDYKTRQSSRIWLKEHGVDYAVGHHFGFPIHLFEDWIKRDFVMPQKKVDYLRKSGSKGRLV